MCGIVGHLAFQSDYKIGALLLNSLNQLLMHRGPDSGGTYLKDEVALAMRRLSIIDLDSGDQPMTSQDGKYTIIFNGEIYNHDTLRKDLIGKGYPIKTRSDTEVLLYSYIDKGENCLQDLNGMFAFAIWNNHEKELFIARDRLGIKPLYYAIDHRRILFASELTPIHQSGLFPLGINHRSISNYLAYWYICEPDTIFKNIFQLPPGSYAKIKNGKMNVSTYWAIPPGRETHQPFEQACEQLLDLLQDSIKLRMKVDVPIGTFLSGGIDSGMVTSIAAQHINERLKSFLIGFKEKSYSELDEAMKTAKRHDVTVFPALMEQLTPEMLDEIFLAFDEPLGNASFVPTYFLSKSASQHVKVVLTGDGADELFGGYPTYQAPYYQYIYRLIPKPLTTLAKSAIGKIPVSHNRISLDFRLKQLMRGIDLNYQQAHFTWREVTPQATQENLFRKEIWNSIAPCNTFEVAESFFSKAQKLSVKNQLMYVDMNTYLLNDHLRKVDRMSMAHSLEARVPFLDHRIVELAMSLPAKYKVNFFQTKRILKHIARDFLPKSVVYGKKKGLTSPIAGWIFSELKEYINDNLKGGLMDELFSPAVTQQILEDHYSKKKDNSRIIWSLITLQIWGKKLKPTNTNQLHANAS